MNSTQPGIHAENFNVPDGKLKFSGEVLELTRKSRSTKTVYLFPDFVRILSHITKPEDLTLFYSGQCIEAYKTSEIDQPDKNTAPISKLLLEEHPVMERLARGLNRRMSQSDFRKWLVSFKRYFNGDTNANYLLMTSTDLVMAKKVKIEKTKKLGNWINVISCESGDTNDFAPPEKFTLTIPMFKGMAERGTFEIDFDFEFEMGADSATTFWTATCPTWTEDKLDMATQLIQTSLNAAEIDSPFFAGKVEIATETDAWSYVHNKPEGFSKLSQ